jgi:hypothetical protein
VVSCLPSTTVIPFEAEAVISVDAGMEAGFYDKLTSLVKANGYRCALLVVLVLATGELDHPLAELPSLQLPVITVAMAATVIAPALAGRARPTRKPMLLARPSVEYLSRLAERRLRGP